MINHQYKLLFLFGLCGFLAPFMAASINLSLPLIGSEFGMNVVSLGWVATAFLLSLTVFLVPFGRLADIWGRRKVLLGGSIVFTIATFLAAFATSGTFLLISRGLQGLGSAMILSTSVAILVSIFPARERGRALGINVAGVYFGSLTGPVFGGIITQYWGWRSIFIISAILSTIVICMTIIYLDDEPAEANGESFDIKGSILYAISVVAILYGTTLLPALTGYVSMASGIALFVIFCIMEDIIPHPIFDIDLLVKNRQFAMANLAALFNSCAAFAVPFLISLYLQYVKGMGPNIAGLILLTPALTIVVGSPITGKLSDSIDPRILATIGMALTALALLIMSFILTDTTPLPLIIGTLFIVGAGMSLFASPNTSAALAPIARRQLSVASSVLNTMRTFGQSLSMGISMLMLSLMVGKVKISAAVFPQFLKSTRLTLFIFGVLCVLGTFASMARGRHNSENGQ